MLIASLKVTAGLFLVGVALYFGAARKPLLSLPVLAVVFTVASLGQKAALWRHALQSQPALKIAGGLAATLLGQAVIVLLLYALGRGVASLLGRQPAPSWTSLDVGLVVGALALAVVLPLVPGGWVDPRTAALDAKLDDMLARAEALNEGLAASGEVHAAAAEPRAREWTQVELEDVGACRTEQFRVGDFELGFSEEAAVTFEEGRIQSRLIAGTVAYDEEKHAGVFAEEGLDIDISWYGMAFPSPHPRRVARFPGGSTVNRDNPATEGFADGFDLHGLVVIEDGWLHVKGHLRPDEHTEGEEVPVDVCKHFEPEEVDPREYLFSSLEEALEADLEHVYRLELDVHDGQALSGLEQLGRLETLTLDLSRATSVPPEVGRALGLKELRLLRGERVTRLPRELFDLKRLERLWATTGVKEWPSEIARLESLKTLSLGRAVTRLPEEITRLPHLEELDLQYNQLTSLPDGLGDIPRLRKLDIRDNPFESLPESLVRVPTVHVAARHKFLYTDNSYKSQNPEPIQTELFFARSDPRLRQEVERVAREHRLGDYTEALLAVARRTIQFRTTEPDDGKAVGHTRFGGVPDLPPDFEYPMTDGAHWTFLAQIDLAQIAPLQDYLPREGLLSFFCQDTTHEIDKSRAVLLPSGPSALARYVYPQDAEFSEEELWEGQPYPGYASEARLAISLPHLYSDGDRLEGVARRLLEIEEKGLSEEYEEARHALAGTTDEDRPHLVNGYVFTQNDSPGEQASFVHGGLHPEWMVLLSLESDGNIGLEFWDAGTLTFSVHKKDLAIGELTNVVVTLESS